MLNVRVLPRTLPVPAAGQLPWRVREVRRGDLDALRSLLAELGHPEGTDAQVLGWVICHPEVEVLVAADLLDRPIGFLGFSHRPQLRLKGQLATVDELVVSAPWRRQGVGRSLIKRCFERARTLCVKRIELFDPSRENDGLYLACGFRPAAPGQFAYEPPRK